MIPKILMAQRLYFIIKAKHHNGFTGVYIATDNGSANTNTVDFNWSDFEKDIKPPYSWS